MLKGEGRAVGRVDYVAKQCFWINSQLRPLNKIKKYFPMDSKMLRVLLVINNCVHVGA